MCLFWCGSQIGRQVFQYGADQQDVRSHFQVVRTRSKFLQRKASVWFCLLCYKVDLRRTGQLRVNVLSQVLCISDFMQGLSIDVLYDLIRTTIYCSRKYFSAQKVQHGHLVSFTNQTTLVHHACPLVNQSCWPCSIMSVML